MNRIFQPLGVEATKRYFSGHDDATPIPMKSESGAERREESQPVDIVMKETDAQAEAEGQGPKQAKGHDQAGEVLVEKPPGAA